MRCLYFEASLLVDHIVRTFGNDKLQALVRSYGEGAEGNAAVEKIMGVSMDDLQASFDKALDTRFGPLRAALREVPGAAGAGEGQRGGRGGANFDLVMLRARASAHPENYVSQLEYGQALATAGDRAAFEPLEKAAALVPITSGEDTPHAIMARLAEQLGDTTRAIAEYKAVLAQDHTTVEAARRLAALEQKSQSPSPETLALAYSRIVAIDPFDPAGHGGLGRLAVTSNDPATAVREFKAALALGPADRAGAHCDLAEALLLASRPLEAKTEALAALEIAPSYDRAQELLLRAIQGVGPAGARQ